MSAAQKSPVFNLYSFLNDEFKNRVSLLDFSESKFTSSSIWLSSGKSSEEILNKFKDHRNFCFVQEDAVKSEIEINFAAKMILEPKEIFINPVKTILDPTGKNSNEVSVLLERQFTEQEEKYEILEAIEKDVVPQIHSNSLVYDIQSITDEMVTNAIFHSTSVIENRKQHMDEGKIGKITIAKDLDRILILCEDPHGKLIPEKLLNRIYTCYTTEIAGTINQGKGGAGIGSFLVHGMSATYILAVQENQKTIIGSILPLKMSNRKRLGLSKNLHCLYLKENKNG
jgi:hypothetical protein